VLDARDGATSRAPASGAPGGVVRPAAEASRRRARRRSCALALALCLAVGPALARVGRGAPPLRLSAASARPAAAAGGIDPYGPEGMNVEAAQARFTTGDPNLVVAYVEGGINWHGPDASMLATAVYVNWRELPVPCVGSSLATATMVVGGVTQPCHSDYSSDEADYDILHQGVVTAADWARDPRVSDANHNGVIDPEDLIAAFSGPAYDPPVEIPAGYPKAISGWDFYDNQNDPATVDAAYDHANDQMAVIHEMCPRCRILPVKAGDEAVDSTTALAKAWLFAYESGARVIVSVTADLGFSSFARQVLDYLWAHGVVVVEASNDFDTPDHQGGMYWDHVVPGNGLVPTTAGVPSGSLLSSMPGPYWTRSDLTSWGPHAEVSVATYGGSTSESSPTLGGILALLLSYGDEAASESLLPAPLTGAQALQVLEEASSQLPDEATLPWPASPGTWNPQYGYGMPDVLSAMQDVEHGLVPAAPSISSPTWYQVEDPTRAASVTVTGSVDAFPDQHYAWRLEYGLGEDPSTWTTLASGAATGTWSGTFGTLPLADVPSSFWAAPFRLSTDKELSSFDQYDVTLRVVTSTVVGGTTVVGRTRRVVQVFHDPSALPGFPLSLGSSGESQPALVDLQGNGRLDIVIATADGTIDAIDPATGRELPGWPVHTDPVEVPGLPPGIDPGFEPIISDVAVGDLEHTGQLSVVATTLDGRVYVFDAEGRLEPGWPQVLDAGVSPPPIPRPALPHTRLPVLGAVAPPVLAPLTGGPGLDIVQAAWDGRLYAFQPDGEPVPGWPVTVSLPAADATPPPGYVLEDDHKLDTPPALARLSPRGPLDVVVRSQFTEISSGSFQPLPYAFVFAYSPSGQLLPGWPVRLQGTIEAYGTAQEFITEGTSVPAAADVLGTGADEAAVGPVWTPEFLLGGSGQALGQYGSSASVLEALLGVEQDPAEAIVGPLPGPTPMPFTGSGTFGSFAGTLTFASPVIGAESFAAALLYPGSGNPILDGLAAWPARAADGGTELAGFPTVEQGDDFLGSVGFAPVAPGGDALLVSGDAGALDARLPGGAEAPGFPKFTGGWVLYGPAEGDLFGTGVDDVVAATREGELFAWSTTGAAPGDGAWWRPFHDEWNSSRYGTDTRPPGAVREATLSVTTETLRFLAPGDHFYDGEAARYDLELLPSGTVETVPATAPAGRWVTLRLPPGTVAVDVQAVNADGLLGDPVLVTASGAVRGGALAPPGASPRTPFDSRVVGIAATPDGRGYWLATADGGVFAFGDASFDGSLAGRRLAAPVVGIAATPDGRGYWLVGADGGVFAFGDASFDGSLPALVARGTVPRNPRDVVGIAATPDGRGYWLVGADGGVFAFGDASFDGAVATGSPLPSVVDGVAPGPAGASVGGAGGPGYFLVTADGGVYPVGGVALAR
jgi:hypothetical protein